MGGSSDRRRVTRRMRTLLVAATFVATGAAAQPADVAAAREAYDRGAAAYDRGEYGSAARQLAKADALAPNDVSLELALKAAVKAEDPLLTMDLVARAEGRRSPTLLAARDEARARMAPRVGRLSVTCAAGLACTATVDDVPFPTGPARWVLAGPHEVLVRGEGGVGQRLAVRVEAGGEVPVRVSQSAAPPLVPSVPREPDRRPPQPSRVGPSPAWFWGGLGVTAVVGGATIASALDTRSKFQEFSARPSGSLSAAGADAELRTNVLLAGTVVCALATGIIGLFVVRSSGSTSSGSLGAVR